MSETYNEPGIEGKIVSGENLKAYEKTLKFDPELLKGKRVLNFGSGGSNLTREVKRMGIDCNMVELDIQKDPSSESSIGRYAKPALKLVDAVVKNQELHDKLVILGRKLSGTEGRTFVQGDGRELPFSDDTFDITFALKSVYQVPANERVKVYAELLRVSKAVHLAPVMTSDYETLTELAETMGFDVILCGPIDIEFEHTDHFPIKADTDYESFQKEFSQDRRVESPPSDKVNIVTVLGKPIYAGFSGGVMILKKKAKNNVILYTVSPGCMAGGQGFEPRLLLPESSVLPLDDPPLFFDRLEASFAW